MIKEELDMNRIAMIDRMAKTNANTYFFSLCTDAEIKEVYEHWKKTGDIRKPYSWRGREK